MNPCDKRGFTLIEVMVTLVILAFGMLASVIGIMTALDHSMMDEMRNDAMKIAQEQQEAARNMDYNAHPANSGHGAKWCQITRQVRKQLVPYTVTLHLPTTSSRRRRYGRAHSPVQGPVDI